MTSIAREDYLKAMWKLGSSNIGTLELANHLKVTPASTTKMILKLSENGLVRHKPYKGASLTEIGLYGVICGNRYCWKHSYQKL